MLTALLILIPALSWGGTAMGRERREKERENEKYAVLEEAFRERARSMLAEQGFQDSGVTLTWTKDEEGQRSYRAEIHHSRIGKLAPGERERLTRALRCGGFGAEVEAFSIVYV